MHKKTLSKNSFKVIKKLSIAERCIQFKGTFRKLLERYPFYFFIGMFVCMLISAVLAFTIMRVEESIKLPIFPGLGTDGVINATTDIIGSYGTLLELEELQRGIAVIVQKDSLSDRDSVHLSDALKRYEQVQRSLMRLDDQKPTS